MGRPAPVPRGTLPLAVSAAWGPPSRSQGSQRHSVSTGRRFRDDRFSCSMPAPATNSRHLYTGRHQGHTQAAPWLRASRGCCSPLSRGPSPLLGFGAVLKHFDASAVVHTCSSSRRSPDPVSPGLFTETLTTTALDRRSFRWFGLSACTASPEGQPPSLAQHGSCWWLLRHRHSPFRTHGLGFPIGGGGTATITTPPAWAMKWAT